jgi:hypothetical protein
MNLGEHGSKLHGKNIFNTILYVMLTNHQAMKKKKTMQREGCHSSAKPFYVADIGPNIQSHKIS